MSGPYLTGGHGSYTTDAAPVSPFAGVTVVDPNGAATVGLSIEVIEDGNPPSTGTLQEGTGFTGTPTLTQIGANTYNIHGTIDAVTAELDALQFNPIPGTPGATQLTDLRVTGYDSSGASSSAYPSDTTVVDKTGPNTLSFSPDVTFKNGVFTLTGSVSSVAGAKGPGGSTVDISATLGNGTIKYLGAATVDANGDFTFKDKIGSRTQTSLTVTELDSNGFGTPAEANYSLIGVPNQNGVAEQDVYTPDGSALTSVSYFQADGLHTTDVLAANQTLSADETDTFNANYQGNNIFVYDPGHGSNTVTDFLLRGAQHDTLSFASADFNNSIASVLAHSFGPGDGTGVVIVDPVTQDTVQLAGVTKRGLVEHRDDISFHG